MTSAPCAWMSRRMMLIAASWPSNNDAAVTIRNGACAVWPDWPGNSVEATLTAASLWMVALETTAVLAAKCF
jgi:hypothetical protein